MTRRVPGGPIEAVRKLVDDVDRRARESAAAALRKLYSDVQALLGPDEAKVLWRSIPPKGARGGRKANPERDMLALLRDAANRKGQQVVEDLTDAEGRIAARRVETGSGGMTGDQSAENLQSVFHEDREDHVGATRRRLDRLWRSLNPEFARLLQGEKGDT